MIGNDFNFNIGTFEEQAARKIHPELTCSSAPPTTNKLVSVFIFSRISCIEEKNTEKERQLNYFYSQGDVYRKSGSQGDVYRNSGEEKKQKQFAEVDLNRRRKVQSWISAEA